MDSWKIYGLTVVALFVKMFAAVLVQGYGRYRDRGFANPEDGMMFDKLFGEKPDATRHNEYRTLAATRIWSLGDRRKWPIVNVWLLWSAVFR
jgi:hypothetical protein